MQKKFAAVCSSRKTKRVYDHELVNSAKEARALVEEDNASRSKSAMGGLFAPLVAVEVFKCGDQWKVKRMVGENE